MIDLNKYSKEFDGIKYVPFDKAVEALNELANQYSTTKLDEALDHLAKATNVMSNIEKEVEKDD